MEHVCECGKKIECFVAAREALDAKLPADLARSTAAMLAKFDDEDTATFNYLVGLARRAGEQDALAAGVTVEGEVEEVRPFGVRYHPALAEARDDGYRAALHEVNRVLCDGLSSTLDPVALRDLHDRVVTAEARAEGVRATWRAAAEAARALTHTTSSCGDEACVWFRDMADRFEAQADPGPAREGT